MTPPAHPPCLVVDVGNTRVKWGLFVDARLQVVGDLGGSEGAGADLPPDGDEPILLGSVRRDDPFATAPWAPLTAGGRRQVLRLATDVALDAPLDYGTPETLGIDRRLAALGAHARVGRSAIVFDAGTAWTCDLVRDNGTFAGGTIGPGIRPLAQGLRNAAPHLPVEPVTEAPGPAWPGSSTAKSLALGQEFAVCGALMETLRQARAVAGPDAPVVLTGGDAELLLARWPEEEPEPLHVPHLVLEGLGQAWLAARGH